MIERLIFSKMHIQYVLHIAIKSVEQSGIDDAKRMVVQHILENRESKNKMRTLNIQMRH